MKGNSKYRITKLAIMACAFGVVGAASATTSEKYTYDASGNISEKNISGVITRMKYDSDNRLISRTSDEGEKVFVYDSAGRMAGFRDEHGEKVQSKSYGYADKIIETNGRDQTAQFYYNAAGELVASVADKAATVYAWDEGTMVMNGDNVFLNESHPSGGVPILSNGQNAVVSDYLGNTLVEGAKQFSASSFGEGLESARFTGKPYIRELESFLYPHRAYSPDLVRWTTTDPAGFPDGRNNYTYVSDPNTMIDPLGTTQLYIGGSPVSNYVVSNAGHGVFGNAIGWNYAFSHSYYTSNSCVGDSSGLDFHVYASGVSLSGTKIGEINWEINVNSDASGNMYTSKAAMDNISASPLFAGVHCQKSGEGTPTLTLDCDGEVGHQGSAVTKFGLNTSGVEVEITGTTDRVHFDLGTWVYKEN